MQIITGFYNQHTPDWNHRLENLKLSAERCGHSVKVFSLPTQDEWLAGHYDLYLSLCWKYKVIFMREAIDQTDEDLIWIDGDCLVTKPIDFDSAIDGCDVAFTLRDIQERGRTTEPLRDGYINSGVVFIKNTPASRRFLHCAQGELIRSLYDQEAFNRVIIKHSNMERHGEVIEAHDFKIKMLNCREYNNFYFDSTANNARILHFKGDGRGVYEQWLTSVKKD